MDFMNIRFVHLYFFIQEGRVYMQLLKDYNLSTIIQIVILLALALKGGISFLEWIWPRLKKMIRRAEDPKKIKYNLRQQEEKINEINKSLQQLIKKVDVLIQSDKDDIKAWITREHHYFVYQKGWIDDYSLDCIEKRYGHYKYQGGNSFIQGLIQEIRSLPKKPSDQT